MTVATPEVTNQWNDFLIRRLDPYASTKYDMLLDWLGDINGKEVLIVGSGSGELAALMANKGADVLATDIDEQSINLTINTAKELGAKLRTQVARLQDLPTERRYDIVVATDVIEHIEDDVAACTSLHALLKEGGRVVITVPALMFLFGYHDEALGHYRRYSMSMLKTLCSRNFSIERCRYYGFMLIPVALLISRWLRRPYPVAEVGAAQKRGDLLSKIIDLFFRWEMKVRPPLGTSLLLIGKAR